MKTRRQNDEVQFAMESIRTMSSVDMAALKEEALNSPTGRQRICMHRSPDDQLHEMLIALRRDVKYPPHRNNVSEETHFVLDGLATLSLFDDNGVVIRVIPLGSMTSGRNSYVRIPAGMFHSLLIESEVCIYMEVKTGPFSPENNEIAIF